MESLPSKDTHRAGSTTKMSTEAHPYHFVGSGLLNVYLVGVQYEQDATTGMQAAEIPCVPNLLEAIGKVLVEKRTALSADEIRFLRKRLRYSSKAFADLVGLSSEQYSRIENDAATVTQTVERVVRLLYAALAKPSPTTSEQVAVTKWTAELNREVRIVACWDEDNHWIVLTQVA